jgi:hypothetical protein
MTTGAVRSRGEARSLVGESMRAGRGARGHERELDQASLRLRAKSEAAAHQGKKTVFHFYFPEFF